MNETEGFDRCNGYLTIYSEFILHLDIDIHIYVSDIDSLQNHNIYILFKNQYQKHKSTFDCPGY